jgi:hypothetical protein
MFFTQNADPSVYGILSLIGIMEPPMIGVLEPAVRGRNGSLRHGQFSFFHPLSQV